MQLKKYILSTLALTVIVIFSTSTPSQPDLPGHELAVTFSLPETDPDQDSPDEGGILSSESFTISVVVDDNDAARGIFIPPQAGLDLSAPTASFVIDYVPSGEQDYRDTPCIEPPAEAISAFEYAASIWAATIHSTVPIRIRACWAEDLGTVKLGYSHSNTWFNFIGAPEENTSYTFALADALHGADIFPEFYDMDITYNSQFDYYYGTDGNTPADLIDFVTIALHEIAHGLNFYGSENFNSYTNEGYRGEGALSNIFDHFMSYIDWDTSTMFPVMSYPTPSLELGAAYRSGSLYFAGANAREANGNSYVKMFAPSVWNPGSSYCHLDYDTFAGTINSLMVYAREKGSSNHDTGPVTRGILKDLGWPVTEIPDPPEIVWASYDTFIDRVRIAWSTSSSTTYYKVYRSETPDSETAALLASPVTGSPYDDYSAVSETDYYYWVKACNTYDCSEFSDSSLGRVGTIPIPEAPTNVSASDGNDPTVVQITWDEPGYATYYRVYRDIDDVVGGFAFTELSEGVPITNNVYKDSPAVDFLYFYWVRACNAVGCSPYSEPDPGWITPTKPLPPLGLTASDGTDKDNVFVNWDASTGATTYQVYRNTIDNTSGAELLAASHPSTSFVDTTALLETDYYYWVRACDSSDCSGYSSSDLGYRMKSPPGKPLGVTASDGRYPGRVYIYWSAPDHTDYYRIFRNTTNSTTGAIEMESRYPINSFDDLEVATGTTYYYFIKACNAEGCSTYSSSESGFAGYSIFLPIIQR